MIQRSFRMLNQFAVEIPTLSVDQCRSHLKQFLKECWAVLLECRAAEKSSLAFGTHMVYRKRFCQSTCIFISSLSSRIESMEFVNWGAASIHPKWKRVKGKNKIKIWNASLDRQPKIQSSSVEETLQRIMGQTNNDCRFRIFNSTNSFHQPRLLAGR